MTSTRTAVTQTFTLFCKVKGKTKQVGSQHLMRLVCSLGRLVTQITLSQEQEVPVPQVVGRFQAVGSHQAAVGDPQAAGRLQAVAGTQEIDLHSQEEDCRQGMHRSERLHRK